MAKAFKEPPKFIFCMATIVVHLEKNQCKLFKAILKAMNIPWEQKTDDNVLKQKGRNC
jgi:hypothetical protein